MFSMERQNLIYDIIKEKGAVRIQELAKLFSVSTETIRRDLLELDKRNCIQRVHGGALYVSETQKYKKLQPRLEENNTLKEELSMFAASMLCDGDTLTVDTGSTAAVFADVLAAHFSFLTLTIITHSLDVFQKLCTISNFNMILCGGSFLKDENAFYGELCLQTIRGLHASKALIFPAGVSIKFCVTDYLQELYQVQKTFMEISDRTIFLVDSSKFEKNALCKISGMNPGDTFVTDSGLPQEIYRLYQENNINIICSGGRKEKIYE